MSNKSESYEAMITRIVFNAVNSALKLNNLAQIVEKDNEQELPVGLKEAAIITRLSEKTIYKKVAQGKIPCRKKSKRGKLYFFKSELLKWLTDAPQIQTEKTQTTEIVNG